MFLARSIIALFVCTVSSLQAADRPESTADGRLELTVTESVESHHWLEDLGEVCRVGHKVHGCTDFPRERIECQCELREGAWVIDGRATVEAVVHVSSAQPLNLVLLHERTHIADLEAGLRAHLDEIGSRHFDSRKACETFARVLTDSPHLRVVMNRLRSNSNKKFGCDRRVRSSFR